MTQRPDHKFLQVPRWRSRRELQDLVGETLAYIDVDEENSEIILTTASGRRFLLYHEQDCCESVSIQDTTGDWHTLVGRVNRETDYKERECDKPYGEHETNTELIFKTDENTVISRWIGESNGYYSEGVNIAELAPLQDSDQ